MYRLCQEGTIWIWIVHKKTCCYEGSFVYVNQIFDFNENCLWSLGQMTRLGFNTIFALFSRSRSRFARSNVTSRNWTRRKRRDIIRSINRCPTMQSGEVKQTRSTTNPPPLPPPCRWLQTHTIWSVQCPVQPWCFNKSFSSHLCGLLSHSAIVTTGWRGFHHTCEVNTWSAHIVFNETQRTTARKSFLTTPLFFITETKLLVTVLVTVALRFIWLVWAQGLSQHIEARTSYENCMNNSRSKAWIVFKSSNTPEPCCKQ